MIIRHIQMLILAIVCIVVSGYLGRTIGYDAGATDQLNSIKAELSDKNRVAKMVTAGDGKDYLIYVRYHKVLPNPSNVDEAVGATKSARLQLELDDALNTEKKLYETFLTPLMMGLDLVTGG